MIFHRWFCSHPSYCRTWKWDVNGLQIKVQSSTEIIEFEFDIFTEASALGPRIRLWESFLHLTYVSWLWTRDPFWCHVSSHACGMGAALLLHFGHLSCHIPLKAIRIIFSAAILFEASFFLEMHLRIIFVEKKLDVGVWWPILLHT